MEVVLFSFPFSSFPSPSNSITLGNHLLSPSYLLSSVVDPWQPPPQSPPIDLLSQWSNADYWRKLCPYLTISSDDKGLADDNDKNIEGCDDVNLNEQLLERLIDDGYALLDSKICNDSLREKLARGISDMEVQHTLPATFILLYDEIGSLLKNHTVFYFNKGMLIMQQTKVHCIPTTWHSILICWHGILILG